ncbi:MAG: hypothetical protein ACE5FZ_01265 [Nitrospiria bacterium]
MERRRNVHWFRGENTDGLFGNLPLKTGLFYVEAVFARESDEKDYPFNLNASRPK